MPAQDLRTSFIGLPKMHGTKSVRRCLFGIPNHEELRRDLDAQLKSTNTEITQTWNFDFDLDKPKSGRFEWSRVDSEDYVPEFYRKVYKPSKFRARRPLIDSDVQEIIDITPPSSPVGAVSRLSAESDSDIEAEAKELQRENETTPEFRPRRQRQSTIVDYMKVKKRRLSEDDEERPSKSARR